MSLGPQYCKQIKEHLRLHAVFPPHQPIALGDFGVLSEHVFQRKGNLSHFGITFKPLPGSGQSTFQFRSKDKVEYSLVAIGDIQPGGVPATRASLELKFGRANAVFFAASGCSSVVIDDLLAVEKALLALSEQGKWDSDFYVVTELTGAARTTAIASSSSNSEVKLEAANPALQAIHLGDVSLDLQVKRSRDTALEIVTESGHFPLMQLARLRGLFRERLSTEAAVARPFEAALGRSEMRLLPDEDTAPVARQAAEPLQVQAFESPAGPAQVEAETAAFLGLARESGHSDFEVPRAMTYISLLEACYAFAHGDENPKLPNGYEIVAPIRRSAQEAALFEAPEGLSREAVRNDFEAMLQEQRGVGVSGAEAALAHPDRFGFVFRERAGGALIVGLRGTQTPAEWLKNFTAVPQPWNEVPGFGLVHLGFEQLWRSVRGSVFAALGRERADQRITLLGHSLGGAMATLGAVDVVKNLGRPTVDLCTFGGPRVGMVRFRKNFNRLISKAFRVVEARDIVPHVPPVVLAFNHVGHEVLVRSKVDNAHSLDSYLEGLRGIGGSPMEAANESVATVLAVPVL